MNPFLKQTAQYLVNRTDISLENSTIIVPNRRSGVFFTAYLNECIDKVMIAPEVLTISDFVGKLSANYESETIGQIFLLHEVYQRVTGHCEPLDEFYFWGEILLHDFNDIDKYLLDANDLFRNIKDLKEIEQHFDYLSEKQLKAIKSFWGVDLNANGSSNRTQFLNTWAKLGEVYHEFRKELQSRKSCYNGMFYRDLVEMWNENTSASLDAEHYVFIGFNALNKAEIQLFKQIQKHKPSLFFWDYDDEFLLDEIHEAGYFMRKNIAFFPPPTDFKLEGGNKEKQRISIVSVPSQIAQTQVINHPHFAPQRKASARFDDNAIVLAEENLLVPTVSAAGSWQEEINITMGYPINNTPVYSFINLLIHLQRNFRVYNQHDAYYYKPVISLLNHQLITKPEYKDLVNNIHRDNKIYVELEFFKGDDLLELLFQQHNNWADFTSYLLRILSKLANRYQQDNESNSEAISLESEYLYQAYLSIQQVADALHKQKAAISLSLFFRLLQQVINRISVPFEGEPLSGMQIMGVLETRNLDFEKLYMFSVNHGRLPSPENTHSFIPYNLRKAFELPTYEEHDAMYAYYFYRMLNRAKEVVLVYDSSNNGITTGEMSRYLYQLIYDSSRHIERLELDFNYKSSEKQAIAVPSTPERRAKLLQRYKENKLSPSALNSYLECKLKFYLTYVAGIREVNELEEDVDNRIFGNLFHEASELVYKKFGNQTISSEQLEQVAKNELLLNRAIHRAFAKAYFKDESLEKVELSGNNRLIAASLLHYLRKMLRHDKQFAPLHMIGLEDECVSDFSVVVDGKKELLRIGGTVDRIDRTAQGTRIIDYKTGQGALLTFRAIDELTDREHKKRPKEIFQTLLYCEIYTRLHSNSDISPNIYKIGDFNNSPFSPEVTLNKREINYSEVREEFVTVLEKLLNDLFSTDNVFDQKSSDDCGFCPYLDICGRTKSQF
ncbi:MAG: PD-(D/E)XK nuclease family protein [Mangrovibacterium sp.]